MEYRLALYSDQALPENRAMDMRLMELIGTAHPKIGYLSSSPDEERTYFKLKEAYYSNLGAQLTAYTDSRNANNLEHLEKLFACDAIHLSGGNTFLFLAWLRESGLASELKNYAAKGNFLIGVSAGAILMTPSIETALLCGDDDSLSDGDTIGLSLVDFQFLPHYHLEKESSELSEQVLLPRQLTYGCPDGAGLIVQGENVETFRKVYSL